MIEAKSSLDYLRSEGIKVLGWKKPIYDGFLFAAEPHILDGAVDENNIKDVRFESGKGILIFNPVPEELKLKNKELLELARNKMIAAAEKGEDFHPAVNKLLDVETEGRSSLIQLLALMANLNLALQISAGWEEETVDLTSWLENEAINLGWDYFGTADIRPYHDFLASFCGDFIKGYPTPFL